MNALEPKHLQVVERWTLILSALVVGCAFVAASRPTAFAVTVGAGLMSLNAWAIRKLAERVFANADKSRPGFAVLLFNAKMIALVGLVYLAVKILGLDAIGFLVGVSVFPVAIVIAALHLNLGAADADSALDAAPPSPPTGDR